MHPLQLHVPTNELEGPKINTINVEPESKGNSQDVSKMEVIDLTSISIVQSLNSLISQTDQDNFDINHVITQLENLLSKRLFLFVENLQPQIIQLMLKEVCEQLVLSNKIDELPLSEQKLKAHEIICNYFRSLEMKDSKSYEELIKR